MRILDLFAGLGGEQRRQYVESRGHEYVTLDFQSKEEGSIRSWATKFSLDKGHIQ